MFPSIGCKERFSFPKKTNSPCAANVRDPIPLKVYDYYLSLRKRSANWVKDNGGTPSAPLASRQLDHSSARTKAEFRTASLLRICRGEFIDFTTNHSWWQNDFVVWDSLLAKQPGKAMLIQETGLQRELNPDEIARRTPESEAALLERKVAASFIQGSGAMEWLWNTNSS